MPQYVPAIITAALQVIGFWVNKLSLLFHHTEVNVDLSWLYSAVFIIAIDFEWSKNMHAPFKLTEGHESFSKPEEPFNILQANLSQAQVAMVNEIFLETILTKVSSNFSAYDDNEWRNLFQFELLLLLPSFTPSLLQLLPTNISCSSYHEM